MVERSRYTNPSRKPKTGRASKVKLPNKGGTLDDFTLPEGKQGSQVSFDPRLLSSGKFSNVTPGRKPETYLGKAAPSGREQDWEQVKIHGTGELRNPPSVGERILSFFGFGPKRYDTLEPEGATFHRDPSGKVYYGDKSKVARRSSMEMGTTEYQSERLDALDNPLVRLGWETLMEQNPDVLVARIHEMLIPEYPADIPPEILKRLQNRNLFSKKDVKKWKSPQDMLNEVSKAAGVLRRSGSKYRNLPTEKAALEWERAASGKDPNANFRKDQVYIRSRPEAGKKTGRFDTFVHELAHAGSYHLKDVWEKSEGLKLKAHHKGRRWPWQDYEDTPAGEHGVLPGAHEKIAGHTYKNIKGRYFTSPKHFFQGEEQLASRSEGIALKEKGKEPDLYAKYASSPRGLSDESFRWMIEHADKEVRRLQKNRLGRVPAAYNISSKKWKSKHIPPGHLPTEHDATIAQQKDNRDRLQRIQSASKSKAPSSQRYLDRMVIEAGDYARATPEERIELDKKEKQRLQFNPQNIIYPNIINLPKKRRGGTVKKRYAKGGGIRKPKGF